MTLPGRRWRSSIAAICWLEMPSEGSGSAALRKETCVAAHPARRSASSETMIHGSAMRRGFFLLVFDSVTLLEPLMRPGRRAHC
jgi:hypothetical protein